MANILITGGAGFIGSNFIKKMLSTHPEHTLINVDSLTYAGNLDNLNEITDNENYVFYKADIRDRKAIEKIFVDFDISYIVNFAAESHVDRSILDPEVFLTTNIIGTQILLDTARKNWSIRPTDKYCREYKSGVKYIQISTDEVYGALGSTGLFTEKSPLHPNSPYSVSKAAADMLVMSYFSTFGLPINVTRCSNNYGPNQFPEKLIPLMINNCINDMELPVYGDGMQIRDWIHVYDHCDAIDLVLHKGKVGEVYNIGGNCEKTNLEIIKSIVSYLGKSTSLIRYVSDRPGHDRRYAIDNTKIMTDLGWMPKINFPLGITNTIEWYKANVEWVKNVMNMNYLQYYSSMYKS